MGELMVEITRENAQRMLIEESHTRPVLIDFWADWCAPCKALMPILDKLVREYAGQVMLAKVNCDELQPIAQQFGVRSLPTVILMKDGQPVDGFVGTQPESAVRQMLEKHLPKPWDILLHQALELLESGDAAGALAPARSAYEESRQRADIAKVYADILIELNRVEEAQVVLDSIPMVDQDGDFERLMSELQLKKQAADTPEIQALLQAQARDLFRRPLYPMELSECDALVFDPPRQGAEAQAKQLAQTKVPRIVAVSCNPSTFVRDARLLLDGSGRVDCGRGYSLRGRQAQVAAGQRNDKLHRFAPTGTRIEIAGQRQCAA